MSNAARQSFVIIKWYNYLQMLHCQILKRAYYVNDVWNIYYLIGNEAMLLLAVQNLCYYYYYTVTVCAKLKIT